MSTEKLYKELGFKPLSDAKNPSMATKDKDQQKLYKELGFKPLSTESAAKDEENVLKVADILAGANPERKDVKAALGPGVGEGLRRFAHGVADPFVRGYDALTGSNVGPDWREKARLADAEFGEASAQNPYLEDIATAAQVAPDFALGAAVPLARGLKGAVGSGGLLGGAMGATQYNPSEKRNLLQDTAFGGAVGAGGPALMHAAGGILNKLRLPELIKGRGSLPEVAQNIQAAQGMPAPIGDIVESTGAKRLYDNMLGRIPGSGVNRNIDKTAQSLNEYGEKVLKEIQPTGKAALDPSQHLVEKLQKVEEDVRTQARAKYAALDKLAEENNVRVQSKGYRQASKALLRELKDPTSRVPIRKGDLYDLMKKGEKATSSSFERAALDRGKLNDILHTADRYGDKSAERQAAILKNALTEDMENSIKVAAKKSPGAEEVKELYDQAQNFYKYEVAPFNENPLRGMTRHGADADMLLPTFLRIGQNDRSKLLKKLMDKLPEDEKLLPAYEYFKRAYKDAGEYGKEFQFDTFARLYKRLKPNQRKTLIPDAKLRRKFDRSQKLIDLNENAFARLRNPQTGQTLGELEGLGKLLFLPAAAGLLGAATGSLSDREVTGSLAGVSALGAGILGARGVARGMQSPRLRNTYLRQMIGLEGKKGRLSNRLRRGGMLGAVGAITSDDEN